MNKHNEIQEMSQETKLGSKTFESFDELGLEAFAVQFEKDIEKLASKTEEALVVSLDAPFGAGKTTFLEMWENRLKQIKLSDDPQKKKYKIVKINAWESDFFDKPEISISLSLKKALESEESLKKTVKKLTRSIGKKELFTISDMVLKRTLGVEFAALKECLKKEKHQYEKVIHLYEKQMEAIKEVKSSLKELVGKLGERRLIILIDELDRAIPDYAIKFLEAIKHFFSEKGIVFIFAVNQVQLNSTAKQMFGPDTDCPAYFQKFFQYNKKLSPAKSLYRFVLNKLREKNIYSTIMDTPLENHVVKNLLVILSLFNFSLRDVEHYILKVFGFFSEYGTDDQEINDLMFFLAAIHFKNEDTFKKLLENNNNYRMLCDTVYEHVKSLKRKRNISDSDNYRIERIMIHVCASLISSYDNIPSYVKDGFNIKSKDFGEIRSNYLRYNLSFKEILIRLKS